LSYVDTNNIRSNHSGRQRPEDDTTVSLVVYYADEEEKIDAVNRWLWNVMTNNHMGYQWQFDSARLWLLLNNHLSCNELQAESKYEYGN
ncbi:hypothetical protein LCGC14_1677540, partial [marine sediment metagenome]